MKLKNPLSISLGKLLYNKRFTVPFSIIFAFVFWLVITIVQNPTRTKTFTSLKVTVPVTDNTYVSEQGLNIVSDFSEQTFEAVISGPNYIVSSLSPSDFLLVASVDEVNGAGTFSLPVSGVTNSSKSGYSFVSVTPATIDVTFDYIDTKKFSVKPSISGVAAADGYVADTAVLTKSEHSQIEISGPRAIINQIKSVTAAAVGSADKAIEKTTVYPASLVLYDEAGNTLYTYANDGTVTDAAGNAVKNNYLTLSVKPSDISITQPIHKETGIPLRATFTNLPSGADADMVVCTVSPAQVVITAADPPAEISLSPIDWRAVSKRNREFTVSIVLPDGVKLAQESVTVKVTVNYEASLAKFSAGG